MRLSQCHLRAVLVLAVSWIACGEATAQPPAPAHVTLTATDGAKLKATYYAAGKPGPGIVLLHQCNRDRQSWWTAFASRAYDSLSDALLAAGNRKEALHNAEKALEVLGRDTSAQTSSAQRSRRARRRKSAS